MSSSSTVSPRFSRISCGVNLNFSAVMRIAPAPREPAAGSTKAPASASRSRRRASGAGRATA